jgi:hypothetical protein
MVRKHLQCHRTNPTSPQYPRHQGRARDATSSLRRSNTGPYPRERTHRASGFPVHAWLHHESSSYADKPQVCPQQQNLRGPKLETFEARKAHAIPSKSSIRHGMHPHSVNRPATNPLPQLKDLLNLKQQQSYVLEARVSRNEAISSGEQSKTILVFTIVTIIFVCPRSPTFSPSLRLRLR